MVLTALAPSVSAASRPRREARTLVLNDDGGWCWFQDERALVVGDHLVLGSVASGWRDPSRRGDVEVVSIDLRDGRVARGPLLRNFEVDDHDAPALLELPKHRVLAVFAKHGAENRLYSRQTRVPDNFIAWDGPRFHVPTPMSRVTYANLFWERTAEARGGSRILNFFRGLDDSFKPSWEFSEDEGRSWHTGGLLVDVPGSTRHRPYAKYASNPEKPEGIHVLFSEGHPRDFDNSLYHVVIRDGQICRSEGSPIRKLREGPVLPEEATRVFLGDSNHVAWPQDLAVDRGGRVRAVFSVQQDSAGMPSGSGGQDLRYHFGTWDGKRWEVREIAHAGTRLYAGEDDYAGGICLHPDDPEMVFLSANVDPVTGTTLPSGHYELFRGRWDRRRDAWNWEALTPGATQDQLRPVVPHWKRGRTALLWLRGTYRKYTDYDLEVVGRFEGGR